MISRELMAPLMFGGLVVFMLVGYPVSFSLAAVGLFFGFISINLGFFDFSLLQALPERVFGIISNDTRKTCSTAWGSCSARSAAAWATR
jgi:TRAP-type mannitol/chloroaromatic compound transport system permease large subunit